MSTRNIVPRVNSEGSLGTSIKKWLSGYFDTLYGNLTGNVTGNVTGNLTGNADTATTIKDATSADVGNTLRVNSTGKWYGTQEYLNVKDFGAVGNGTTDDTSAFSSAASAATGNSIVNWQNDIPTPLSATIYVPEGNYLISSLVNTGNKDITWLLGHNANIINPLNLNGRWGWIGQRMAKSTYGTYDLACAGAIRANPDNEHGAEVLGLTAASQLASYTDRDSVGLYVDNIAPAALDDVSTATYTATTVTITAPSSDILKKLRKGMIIDTKHSPKYSGFITSWNTDGSVITVTGWYKQGDASTTYTPANGTGCIINPITKIWAHNANVTINSGSVAQQSTGFELGLFNQKEDASSDILDETSRYWGFDSVNLGTYAGQSAFIARNNWRYGFVSYGSTESFVNFNSSGHKTFSVAGSVIDLGTTSATDISAIDFHSSGTNVDYDCRIYSTGGTDTREHGTLTFEAGVVRSLSDFVPVSNAAASLGNPSNRWNTVFAATGTINTSDARVKEDIKELSEVEKEIALELKSLIKTFRFKADPTKVHTGIIAQEVLKVFDKHGLNAEDYGLISHDTWDEVKEIKDRYGVAVVPHKDAGDLYGIRYEELLCFIISAI